MKHGFWERYKINDLIWILWDTGLGLPFNIASYGLLLQLIGEIVNMVPDELVGNLGDVHLYNNHIEPIQEQLGRDFTEDDILLHLQESGMDALKNDARKEYVSKLPKNTREPFALPKVLINSEFWPTENGECGVGPLHSDFSFLIKNIQIDDFQLMDYESHPKINLPLSN